MTRAITNTVLSALVGAAAFFCAASCARDCGTEARERRDYPAAVHPRYDDAVVAPMEEP